MNVLSPEDANESSTTKIQSARKSRKEQAKLFHAYELSLKQPSERQKSDTGSPNYRRSYLLG